MDTPQQAVPEPQIDPHSMPCTGDNTCPWCNFIDSAKSTARVKGQSKPAFSAETVARVTKYFQLNPRKESDIAAKALGLSRATIDYIRRDLVAKGVLLPKAKQGTRGRGLW